MKKLRQELETYYTPLRRDRLDNNSAYAGRRDRIFAAMDAYETAHPDTHPYVLKARLHEEIAQQFEPVVFRHSPFFFEMGVRPAESWGVPNPWSAGSWMFVRRNPDVQKTEMMSWVNYFRSHNAESPVKLWTIHNIFDYDHHCLGYTRLLQVGINGVIDDIAAARSPANSRDQSAFLEAAERSCRARRASLHSPDGS